MNNRKSGFFDGVSRSMSGIGGENGVFWLIFKTKKMCIANSV